MEKELRTNAVKMSPEEQYQIRKSIIRLFKQGKKNGEIAEILDVSERHVRSVKKQYAEGGINALKPQKTRTRHRREENSYSRTGKRNTKNNCGKRPDAIKIQGLYVDNFISILYF